VIEVILNHGSLPSWAAWLRRPIGRKRRRMKTNRRRRRRRRRSKKQRERARRSIATDTHLHCLLQLSM
jgi:hypothetical protein